MMLFEIDPVGWAKGALAPCPPSIGSLILNGGHASTFALPPSLFELRRTGRATADKSLLPTLCAVLLERTPHPKFAAADFDLSPQGRGEVAHKALRVLLFEILQHDPIQN
jgi:hypothetical protein